MGFKHWKVGDYVQVIKEPLPWEGAGESREDRISLIGHVGILLELDTDEEWASITECMAFVGFVGLHTNKAPQRNIEVESLEFVTRPKRPLSEFYPDNC